MSEEAQKYLSARRSTEEASRAVYFAITMSDDSSEEDYVNTINKCLLLYHYNEKKKRNKPRFWISDHIRERPIKGELMRMFYDLQDEYFKNYFRVDRKQFEELLSLINEDITKQDTNFRKAVSPREKLAITLR